MQRKGGWVFCTATQSTHLLSWEPAETFPLCLLHESRTRKQISNGSSSGCLLCKLTAPCWSSQLQDLGHHPEDSRPQRPLHPVCRPRSHLACSSHLHGIQEHGRQSHFSGAGSSSSISNQTHRQVSKARNKNITRSCQKNDRRGAK